ncbi:MAG: glycosyltransferase family 39 protein [Chloroflexi bacterium]|nr:glycosyltransferase family 39 protein [Chloroflexota bacterium]
MTNLRIHSLIPRMDRQPTSRHHTHNLWPWLMVALLLLAFALRLHRAGDRAVWWDEGWSVWVARQSLAQIAYQTGHDVHPPVYFWLLHLWRAASGDSEFGLRMFSAVFGTLTIAATYLLGRATANKPVGFLAALFLTLSRFHIVWSQEMRMYALAGFLAVLGTWAARRVWARGKPADYALYIFCMTAGLLTLYLFFPIPVAINIAWLWELRHAPNRRQSLLKWGAAQLVILGIVGAWLVYALPGFLSTSSGAGAVGERPSLAPHRRPRRRGDRRVAGRYARVLQRPCPHRRLHFPGPRPTSLRPPRRRRRALQRPRLADFRLPLPRRLDRAAPFVGRRSANRRRFSDAPLGKQRRPVAGRHPLRRGNRPRRPRTRLAGRTGHGRSGIPLRRQSPALLRPHPGTRRPDGNAQPRRPPPLPRRHHHRPRRHPDRL